MKALALLFALPLFAPLMPGTSAAPFIAQDAGQDVERPLSEQVDELFADNDFDALVTLWKAHEVRALSTIDRDLEGSLAIWEAAQKREDPTLSSAEELSIATMHRRALFSARAASAAFDRPIFSDYASSFVSWNAEQKASFRAGQAAFSEAMGALGKSDMAAALAAAKRCTDLAMPLGDWWGAAMGLGLSGMVLSATGESTAALADLAQSRLYNQNLGLRGAERRDLATMLTCLEATGQTARAIAVCDDLLEDALGAEKTTLEEKRTALIHAGM
jgi:hypothetical protein